MKFAFYTHSLVSDWNHGNAHFLRGVMRALQERGHEALALEPENGWSRRNLLLERGREAIEEFHRDFPELVSDTYGEDTDHEALLDGADVVIIHEWTEPALVARIGRIRAAGARFTLLFHDTHHRAVSAEGDIASLDLSGYDGVLAFGETLRERYAAAGWGRQAFTWHEAADATLFRPIEGEEARNDLVWIGNWGDGERAEELEEFLFGPVEQLRLTATIHGVRYPPNALARLEQAGIDYAGYLPNARAPRAFARHRVTVHVPRRPYVESLRGIPTIRPFEALACGIPLASAPWEDAEGLFRPGDIAFAANGREMARRLGELVLDRAAAREQAARGRETVLARHTCGHRADELLAILGRLAGGQEDRREMTA